MPTVGSIMTELKACGGLSHDRVEAWGSLVSILQKGGGVFYTSAGRSKVDPKPERAADNGDLHMGRDIGFEHPFLGKGSYDFIFPRPIARAGVGYVGGGRNIELSQATFARTLGEVDAVANGQLAVAKLLAPYVHPEYGWIDSPNAGTPIDTDVLKVHIPFLCWANFFGPAYIEKFGRSFLLKAPAYRSDELADGTVVIVVDRSYCNWRRETPHELLEYLRMKRPKLRTINRRRR